MMKALKTAPWLLIALFVLTASTTAARRSRCVSCHEKETPGIVKEFLSGKKGQVKDMDCSSCHGSKHQMGERDAKAFNELV